MTKFWLTIAVLLLVHTVVCFGADRIFTTRHVAPPGAAPIETTTPEQQARGERVFVSITVRVERPFALVFYAIGGYVGLLTAATWGVFTFMRSHPA
jgi:hypothetical protein